MFLIVGVLGALFQRDPPRGLGPVVAIACLGMIVLSLVLFAGRWSRSGTEEEQQAKRAADRLQLERTGLLVPEPYKATRAFQVAELEDEGSHYFIELEDGSVLFLSGQYLYEYEPRTRRGKLERPRTFPCTQFALRRHRNMGHLVDIECSGPVLEPEAIAPSFSLQDSENYRYPGDQSIIRNKSYDEIKSERLSIKKSK